MQRSKKKPTPEQKTIRFIQFNNLVQTGEAEMDMNASIREEDAMFDEAMTADKEDKSIAKRIICIAKAIKKHISQWIDNQIKDAPEPI